MARVKSYKRRTKSGKTVIVRAHSRKEKEGVTKSMVKGNKESLSYYQKNKRDIDDIMEQTGISLEEAVQACKDYERENPDGGDMISREEARKVRAGQYYRPGKSKKKQIPPHMRSSNVRFGTSFYK